MYNTQKFIHQIKLEISKGLSTDYDASDQAIALQNDIWSTALDTNKITDAWLDSLNQCTATEALLELLVEYTK